MNIQLATPTTTPSPILIPASKYNIPNSTPDDYVFRIDNSTLETIQACPRAGAFYVIQRRTRKRSAALDLGTAVHFIEQFYRDGFNDQTYTQILQRVEAYYNTPNVIQDEWRTQLYAETVIQKYYQNFKSTEPITVLNHKNQPLVEIPFEISLGTVDFADHFPCPLARFGVPNADNKTYINKIHIYWIGRIDLAVSHLGYNWILDHKTASRLGDTFWQKFHTSSQMQGYTWALSQITKLPVNGAIINVIAVRKPTRTGTSVEFERQHFNYTPSVIEEWKHDTMASICDFLSSIHRNHFPSYPCNCVRWYGMCQYFDVCRLDPEHRLGYLSTAEYEPVTWDPTTER